MRSNTICQVMADWAYLQINGLDRTKSSLYLTETFVTANRILRRQVLLRQACAYDVNTIQRSFGGYLLFIDMELKAVMPDVQYEVLANLELVYDFADPYTNLVLAAVPATFYQRSDSVNCLADAPKSSFSRTIAVFNKNVKIGLPNVHGNTSGQVVLADDPGDPLPEFTSALKLASLE